MVSELTGLDIANASLLDEATAAAESMHLAMGQKKERKKFFAADTLHPQTLGVLRTRADGLGLTLIEVRGGAPGCGALRDAAAPRLTPCCSVAG